MTKDQAIKHFGTQMELAKALGMSQGSVSLWDEYPPALRQLQIEAVTGGVLRAEPSCDKYRVPAAQAAA
jgi:DNA-binding transcriptional regulator YdaS (Cro superfamily)